MKETTLILIGGGLGKTLYKLYSYALTLFSLFMLFAGIAEGSEEAILLALAAFAYCFLLGPFTAIAPLLACKGKTIETSKSVAEAQARIKAFFADRKKWLYFPCENDVMQFEVQLKYYNSPTVQVEVKPTNNGKTRVTMELVSFDHSAFNPLLILSWFIQGRQITREVGYEAQLEQALADYENATTPHEQAMARNRVAAHRDMLNSQRNINEGGSTFWLVVTVLAYLYMPSPFWVHGGFRAWIKIAGLAKILEDDVPKV